VNQNKNIVSVERDTQTVLLHNDWLKKRLAAKTLEEYLEIGKNLDTVAKNFAELKFDSIVAINHLSGGLRISGDTTKTDTIIKRQLLSPNQSNNLLNILDSKKTYESSQSAMCFEPHMTFVFFNGGKIVSVTSVCLSCMKLITDVKLPKYGLIEYESLRNIGEYGASLFSNLCYEIGFSECNYSKKPK
jgi:hypothetical protein